MIYILTWKTVYLNLRKKKINEIFEKNIEVKTDPLDFFLLKIIFLDMEF